MKSPSRVAASGLLFSGRGEARRFSPMPFVVFVILAVLAVLVVLLLIYLVAQRWMQ
jgi:cobalamin biosynthesis Mg chelatase CobN